MGKTFKDDEAGKRTAWIGRSKRERNFNPNKRSYEKWCADTERMVFVKEQSHETMYDDAASL